MNEENLISNEEKEITPKKTTPKKSEPKPIKKLRVVLTCPKYTIVVDENGNNIQIDGNYNVKIGDYMEVK